jgi:hypothetical protein
MRKEEKALRWIVSLLRTAGVSFQVAGGLAARAYGAERPIADLDFYVPTARLEGIAKAAAEYVEHGPMHICEAGWDITFMKLSYAGQRIELGGAEDVRIFDHRTGQWAEQDIDLSKAEMRKVLGVEVPVMPFEQLVAYKRRLNRAVDRQDLAEMCGSRREA